MKVLGTIYNDLTIFSKKTNVINNKQVLIKFNSNKYIYFKNLILFFSTELQF